MGKLKERKKIVAEMQLARVKVRKSKISVELETA